MAEPEPSKKREGPPPIEFVRPEEAPPPAPQPSRPAAWVPGPEEFESRPVPPARPRSRIGGRSMVAGILLLMAGLIGIADSLVVLSRPLTPEEIAQYQNATATERVIGVAAGLASLYAQAFAVVAGVLALQKRNWTLATACAVLALLAGGPFGFVSSLLALVALVFVAAARREFTS